MSEPSVDTAEGRALTLCGHPDCRTWRSKPCGEGCYWSPPPGWNARDAALAEAQARVLQLERQVDTLHEAWGGQTLLAEARAAAIEECAVYWDNRVPYGEYSPEQIANRLRSLRDQA